MLSVQFVASVIQVSLTARMLGPEGYGHLSVLIAITGVSFGLLSVPGHDAITTYVTRSVSNGKIDEAAATLRFAILSAFVLSLIAYGVLGFVGITFAELIKIDRSFLGALLLFGTTGIWMSTYREGLAILRAADRLHLGVIVSSLAAFSRIAVLATGWTANGGIMIVVSAYVAGAAVNGVGMFVAGSLSAKYAGVTGLFESMSMRVPADVVRFQSARFCRGIVETLATHIDVLLIAHLSNSAQLGLFRATRQIVESSRLPFYQLESSVQLEYSKQWYAQNGVALRGLAHRSTIFTVLAATVGFGILILLRKPILSIVLGDAFAASEGLILILIPGAFGAAAIASLHVLPTATGRGIPLLFARLIALCAQVTLILLLVPKTGAGGAAWSYTTFFVVYILTILPFAALVLRQSNKLRPT